VVQLDRDGADLLVVRRRLGRLRGHGTLWDSGGGSSVIDKWRATVWRSAAGRLVLRADSRRSGTGCLILGLTVCGLQQFAERMA